MRTPEGFSVLGERECLRTRVLVLRLHPCLDSCIYCHSCCSSFSAPSPSLYLIFTLQNPLVLLPGRSECKMTILACKLLFLLSSRPSFSSLVFPCVTLIIRATQGNKCSPYYYRRRRKCSFPLSRVPISESDTLSAQMYFQNVIMYVTAKHMKAFEPHIL